MRQPFVLDPLTQAIDYAGLFPPAQLSMETAVANFADYRSSADQWALGRFIVPAARLAELTEAIARVAHLAWTGSRISATLGPDSAADWGRIDDYNRRWSAEDIQVDAVEAKVTSVDGIDLLRRQLPVHLTGYGEIPLSAPRTALLERLAALGLRAKIRMGGVTRDTIPPAELVAGFLLEVAALRLPFKATAGLHHPIRGEYRLTYADQSPTGVMYGFLNLLVATLIAEAGAPREMVIAALLETEPGAIRWGDGALQWRDHHFDRDQIVALRQSFHGFGSCSFREPIDELEPALSA